MCITFATNMRLMETTSKSSKSMDWILFLLSLIVTILLLIFVTEWFWVSLPFLINYLVKALDSM